MISRLAAVAISGALLAGCNGYQNAIGGDGAESANFVQLFTLFMVVCTIMYVIVSIALIGNLETTTVRPDR